MLEACLQINERAALGANMICASRKLVGENKK